MSDETINKMARGMWKATIDSIGYTDEEATLISGDDWHQFIDYAKAAYPVVSARIAELESDNATLREALKPFEEELRNQELEVPQVSDGDSLIHSYGLRLRDLQAARAALKGERG